MASGFSRAFVIAFAILLTALPLRIANAPLAFEGGVPQLTPADELYHWKRMEFTAQHFPRVLELDPDRGVGGAFCPWPPLYDLAGGLTARLFGLSGVVWIPPIGGAICAALAAMWVTRRYGTLAGVAAGIALAASPFIVTQSSVGNIDHHWLEWPLVFGIIAAVVSGRRSAIAASMCAALFVQTALIIACGLAFVAVFAGEKRRSAAGAFLATAIAVAVYRLTRSPSYPDSAWFLGWPHAGLLLGAAVACAIRPRAIALLCGTAVAAAGLRPLLQGVRFFGGDPWLESIVEFQPMWRSYGSDLTSQIAGLSIGAVLVWILMWRRPAEAGPHTIALFAIVFLILTITNRRFWSISIPLLAIAGAICAASFTDRRLRVVLAAAVAIVPSVQLIAWMRYPSPPIARHERAWIDAAKFLHTQPPGRVLAPWHLGHTIDVIGRHAVVIDNFGTMPDAGVFERANAALVEHEEAQLAQYCDETKVRYVVLTDPEFGLKSASRILGIDMPANFARATWWWRTYDGAPAAGFRVLYRSDSSFSRAALVVLEYQSLHH